MKIILAILGVIFFFSPCTQAQTRTDPPYLLPQTIFVGDSGRLVVPLGTSFAMPPFILDTPDELLQAPNLVIRRIELERRSGNSRLLIDFIPYEPGSLSLPAFGFLFPDEAVLPPLKVQVASILNPSNMNLSEPASPLAVPGTSFLIYGSIVLILILISLGIGCSLWSRRHFSEFWERLYKRHLLRGMMKFLRRLKQECGPGKNAEPAQYLSLLSSQSREFFSLFSGINCRSLAASEFLELPLDSGLEPVNLCRLFRTWDTLRFSGRGMELADLFLALEEMEALTAALDRAERERLLPKSLQIPIGEAL
jgi:hypothetical protein